MINHKSFFILSHLASFLWKYKKNMQFLIYGLISSALLLLSLAVAQKSHAWHIFVLILMNEMSGMRGVV